MSRLFARLGVLALAATTAACTDSTPTPPLSDAAFSLTASGSTTVELTGTTLKLPTQVGGYRETVNGREYAVDLTPVMLVQSTSSLSTSPQLSLNLLGPIETGSYRIHREGTVPGVAKVQARLIVPVGADQVDHFLIDAGMITVTSLSPFTATFSFTGTQRIRRPRETVLGQSITSQPAPITVTGRIGGP
ncbi:MAG: hypothetical protein LCH84_07220 [Gemmatimonadetes bacterium]|nr:hypothetical protein [Gemmatimonadota bacterium]